jgi:hypothetical protein
MTTPTPKPTAELSAHPLSELFPRMDKEELDTLAEDIKANELKEAILLFEDKILDGNNRYSAGLKIGYRFKETDFRQFDPKVHGDPLAFVVSQNLHRRHLTESQRAAIAATLVNTKLGYNQYNRSNVTNKKAAEMLGVGVATVKMAKDVAQKAAPEIQELVRKGDLRLGAAKELGTLRWRKDYSTERNGCVVVGRTGEIAGHANNQGRVQIHFQGRAYYRSRLIYKLHTGREPQVVQYLNGNTLDDRFENLKNVTNNAYAAVRDTRDRDQDYFVITRRTGADGCTVKTVVLSWRCAPDENPEAIAKELNQRCEDYLRGLNRERLAREAERDLANVPEAQRQSASAIIHRLMLGKSEEEQQETAA